MGSRLKLCSGKEAVKKLKKDGWSVARQAGSHVMMVKPDYQYTLSIPQHSELGIGILKKLVKQARLTVAQFNELKNNPLGAIEHAGNSMH